MNDARAPVGGAEGRPGNHRPISGIKGVTDHGWFAARLSGTEAAYKPYAESFEDRAHPHRIQRDASAIIQTALSTQTEG